MSALGPLLRGLREESGLTQEELADRAEVSARTISDIERGLRRRVYADTAGRLAAAMDLDGATRASFLDAARGRGADTAEAVHALPYPLTPLVGRTSELEVLVGELQPGVRRLVTVTGLGGAGKTRLALAVAARLETAYDGRVRLVRFAAGADPRRVVDAIASALRMAPTGIAAGVAGRPTLVVLDGFEHVLAAAGPVAELLARAPDLHALVTSRERLRLPGEREVALGPLPPAEARQLFLDRLRDFSPDPAYDDQVVADICRQLSGLPLPLELAAADVRHVPLAVLRDRLRTDRTDARQVVADAVTWSVSALDSGQRAVLAAAAVFQSGWGLEALRAVVGEVDVDVVGALAALADRGLVQLDGVDVPRWRMLDVVREVVQTATPPGREQRRAFLGYYGELVDQVSGSLGREGGWYDVLASEEPNIQLALRWAEEEGDAATVLHLATGMWLFWQARGGLALGRHWLSRGLAMSPPGPARLRAQAWWGMGWLAYHQGDDEAAEAAGRELAALAGEQDEPSTRRNALTIRGIVAIAGDRPDDAVAALDEALTLARDLDAPWILATSLLNLGLAWLAADDTEGARAALGEALATYDEIGDRRFHARCLGYLGLTSLLEGATEQAESLFARSLRVFVEVQEPAGTAEGLAGLAAAAAAGGRSARAATLAGAAERLRETIAARELPLERRAMAAYLIRCEQELGAEAWAAAWQSGRELEPDAAVALALG